MLDTETVPSANRQIARAAGTIMLAFALSNLIGLGRQILISRLFAPIAQFDAFYAASTFPNLIFNLVAWWRIILGIHTHIHRSAR